MRRRPSRTALNRDALCKGFQVRHLHFNLVQLILQPAGLLQKFSCVHRLFAPFFSVDLRLHGGDQGFLRPILSTEGIQNLFINRTSR